MENAISIRIPISVSYPAIEDVLKKQMVGEFIPRPEEDSQEPPYAQILDVGIAKSSTGPNDVILAVKMRVLRTMLKRDQVDLYVQATLDYDSATEQLFVQRFKLESRTSSGFYNTALEVLANKVAYNQILKKTRFDLRQIISKELEKANGMLDKGLELKGFKLIGRVEAVRVQEIALQQARATVLLEIQGDLEADIFDLLSLMPA
ncbi:putative sterol carrier protein [Pontibacter aydingkolensis]|uniref:DUF4403 family protein n=1 Tax=Pontibacter aydingkolensis TaxID=1911536 RepID=A0ABS7CUK6_9BACT|nr:DUF4403 family protein [Pontibacter aydingkolensis]MBW7467475.1 DUF4403 family protein [Pontibacter aydingkolensis]